MQRFSTTTFADSMRFRFEFGEAVKEVASAPAQIAPAENCPQICQKDDGTDAGHKSSISGSRPIDRFRLDTVGWQKTFPFSSIRGARLVVAWRFHAFSHQVLPRHSNIRI